MKTPLLLQTNKKKKKKKKKKDFGSRRERNSGRSVASLEADWRRR